VGREGRREGWPSLLRLGTIPLEMQEGGRRRDEGRKGGMDGLLYCG